MMRLALGLILLLVAFDSASQESKNALEDGPGKEKTMQCVACHSLDYIPMNSHFLDKAGWTATVNKMINAFGAPIPKDDIEPIVNYLTQHYGKQPQNQAGRTSSPGSTRP
jgi:hypothetical protein